MTKKNMENERARKQVPEKAPSNFFQLFYTSIRSLPLLLRLGLTAVFSIIFVIYMVWNAQTTATKESLIRKFTGYNVQSDRVQDDTASVEKLQTQWQEASRPSENDVFLREATAGELFKSIKSISGVPPLEYESLLKKIYYGKVRWEVTVESLHNSSWPDGSISVTFSDQEYGKGGDYMEVVFSKKWRSFLEQLRIGDQIRFEGLIYDIIMEGVLRIKEGRLLAFRRVHHRSE